MLVSACPAPFAFPPILSWIYFNLNVLGDIYHKGYWYYREKTAAGNPLLAGRKLSRDEAATLTKVRDSSEYLADHMGEAPVLLVPCIRGRVDGQSTIEQAGVWGSILPAVWSFMLAARERGLGTSWTTVHLYYEQEAAQVLGIPYDKVTQAALVPVAYTLGTDFKPAPRVPMESIVHWNQW